MTLERQTKNSDTLYLMLASDVHFDSSLSDLQLFTDHLKQAEELKAPVLIAGDLLDAMQGRDDPRRAPEELLEKYHVSQYYDALVLDASDFLRGFKIPYYILGTGNHESAVLKHSNTNLIERLAYDLRLHGQPAEAAGYWGYLRIMFQRVGKSSGSKIIYFHHSGVTGNAPVTKGMLAVNRQATYIQSADYILNGHNHHAYVTPVSVERLTPTMRPYSQTVWYLRSPGYKLSPADSLSVNGYGVEKFRAPTPRGCLFLRLDFKHKVDSDLLKGEVIPKIC